MNIAQRFISRYESEDFINEYKSLLAESFGNNKGDIANRIIDLFNVSNYETEKSLSNHLVINREQAKLIFAFIEENIDEFTKKFSSYYVGYTSLESVSFGEQEEQLTGIKGGIKYIRSTFRKEGFFVKGDYAYYSLDGGLHIDLLGNIELLNDFLATIKEPVLVS